MLFACTAQMSKESDSLLCHRQRGVICLCDLRPCLAGHEKMVCCCTNHPTCPPVKQRQMKGRLRRRNQATLHVLYASQSDL